MPPVCDIPRKPANIVPLGCPSSIRDLREGSKDGISPRSTGSPRSTIDAFSQVRSLSIHDIVARGSSLRQSDDANDSRSFQANDSRSFASLGPQASIGPQTTMDGNMFQLMRGMDKVIVLLESNLKFTKALYRGTKRGVGGPERELSTLTPSLLPVRASQITSQVSDLSPRSFAAARDSRFSFENIASGKATSFIATQANPRALNGSVESDRKSSERKDRNESTNGSYSPSNANSIVPSSNGDSTYKHMNGVSSIQEYLPVLDTLYLGSPNLARTRELASAITLNLEDRKKHTVKLWKFLEDKHSSRAAFWFDRIRNTLLICSVVLSFFDIAEMSAIPWQHYNKTNDITYVQIAIEGLFAVELVLRFIACRDRYAFCQSVFNIVDLASVCPCIMRIFLLVHPDSDSVEIFSLFGVVPVLRLLKLLQHSDHFQLLLSAFVAAGEIMPMLLFTMFLIATTFAAMIYYCEPRSGMPSLPISIYFSIVTCSTVGYGDFVPQTTGGRILTSLLSIVGPMYMAMPIGIIGTAFSETWNDRHRLLILQKMRKCVSNAGYTPTELLNMFKILDQNHDGALDINEFIAWLSIMDISAGTEFSQQVFESFDADDEGTIDFEEFLRGLYPRSFGRIHEKVRRTANHDGANSASVESLEFRVQV